MHANQASVGAVNKGIAAGDWAAVQKAFDQFAANALTVLTYAPPKGDLKEWQRLWNDFLAVAKDGSAAAVAKDAARAKADLDKLVGDRNKGHPQFKG